MTSLKDLLELSHNRKDNAVTPIVLEYHTLLNEGYTEKSALEYLQKKYNERRLK